MKVRYPVKEDGGALLRRIEEFADLQAEYGADAKAFLQGCYRMLEERLEAVQKLPGSARQTAREPDELEAIRALCSWPEQPLMERFDSLAYRERLEGALLARFAGCTLGAPIELQDVSQVEAYFQGLGEPYPPVNYLTRVENPQEKRYAFSLRGDFERDRMHGVPCDDDITYTLLGLLLAEEYGLDLLVEQVAQGWVRYLPFACTAEEVALKNLRAGIPPRQAAEVDNPYVQWIGAAIRADAWGYIAPGNPALAARLAHTDAFLTHRRNGIYSEMFFAAAVSAAFCLKSAEEVFETALQYIPRESWTAQEVRFALEQAPKVQDYRDARRIVAQRYAGMHPVHALNNLCLTILGVMLGGGDLTRVLSQTVAMGLDNDCTTATAGSIAGALYGKQALEEYWYRPFENRVYTYLNGHREFAIDDVVNRFTALARVGFRHRDHIG